MSLKSILGVSIFYIVVSLLSSNSVAQSEVVAAFSRTQAVMANHFDELKLTPQQLETMEKLKDEAAKKIQEAWDRFAKEIESITEKAHVEFRNSLNADQKQVLDKYLPPSKLKEKEAETAGRQN
jgi:vacuolar-type H+-ATPase subunit H